MRSTIIAAAAFAVSAVAVPYANPDVVTAYDTDVVYVTNVVTVTDGAAAPTTVAAADAAPTPDQGNGGWHWPHKHQSKKTKTKTRTRAPAPQPPTSTPQPPPAYPTSTWAEPEPTTAAEPSPEPQPTQASGYNDIVVVHHNVHRANHSAPDVQWDAALAATAQKIAAGCVYAHDTEMDGGGYGQNIAAGVEANNVSAVITDLFYNGEVGYYDGMYGMANPDMTNFELWGHFSQIVWKGTNKVGCATQHCPNGLGNVGSTVSPYFTVCNYGPPGNYGGEYGDNVLAPKNDATVQWNYAQ